MKVNLKYIIPLILIVLSVVIVVILLNKNDKSYSDYIDNGIENYYENKHDGSIKASEDYTDDKDINSAIESLKISNGYSTVLVVSEWDDIILNVHSYEVVFDDLVIYTISKDESGLVYSNVGDYDYYKELNQ